MFNLSNFLGSLHSPAVSLDEKEKSQRVVVQLEMPELFGRVPWGHHIDIVSRCETIDEALFYIKNDIDGGWSRSLWTLGALLLVSCCKSTTYFGYTSNISQEFGYKDAGKRMDLLYIDVKLEKKIP